MEMTREDYRAVRHLLRFAGMGVTPAPEVLERAVDRVSMHLATLPDVQGSMERLRAGILPSQASCAQAESQLSRYFEEQGASDVDSHRMMQH